ncbi:DNA cytosine methyltransferase [Deinococcus multiflagellatus]|uniref:DNA (cytosine-5-)-methyltransferase n=1 Tax=Deinococcus multiflagellatus TaxID=1656887 RepID=A0ABW1ZF02_9DEIO
MKRTKKTAPAYAPLFPYLPLRENAVLAPGELVIDNFAGVGGASTGMEAALGRPVDHAINHDPVAVSLHRVNHPHSHHSIEDVWQVDPREVTRGQPVALCWFSPTCTHFSKAKGAALLDRGIRGLAWVAVRWAALVRPRVIILENVEEFRDWCPLTPDGRPDLKQKGRTFNSFVNALRYQGYQVEWRELRACDYGTPTIRKRLFLIARRDGLPIIWPEPTHAAPTDARVKAGLLQPYRTAAECIDWDLFAPSIFDRKKPLVRNTHNRIAQGIRRFVLEARRPFIVTGNHGGEGFRGQPLDQPFNTITAAHEAHGLVAPHLTKFNTGSVGQDTRDPIATITAGGTPARESTGNTHGLVAAQLVTYYGRKSETEARGQNGTEPLRTQTTENRHALATAHLIQHNGGSLPPADANYPASSPARTVLAQGAHRGW